VKFMEDLHTASNDINFEIIDTCTSKFDHFDLQRNCNTFWVFRFRLTGSADGCREWLGIAKTGKKFENKCFIMMKVLSLHCRDLI
jgi:hypothetical protein